MPPTSCAYKEPTSHCQCYCLAQGMSGMELWGGGDLFWPKIVPCQPFHGGGGDLGSRIPCGTERNGVPTTQETIVICRSINDSAHCTMVGREGLRAARYVLRHAHRRSQAVSTPLYI